MNLNNKQKPCVICGKKGDWVHQFDGQGGVICEDCEVELIQQEMMIYGNDCPGGKCEM